MRPILFWLLLCLIASPVFGQKQDAWPSPSGKPILTIVYDSSMAGTALVEAFRNEPDLLTLRQKVTYNEISINDPLYKGLWQNVIPLSQTPAVMVQDPTNGGVIYFSSSVRIPPFNAIDDEIAKFWETYAAAKKLHEPTIQQAENPNCPDGNCPVPSDSWNSQPQERILLPSLLDTIAKRPTPIRDTISGAIWLLVLAVVAVFMMLVAFAVLAFVVVVAVNRRNPPE